jgi:hypothetical protein
MAWSNPTHPDVIESAGGKTGKARAIKSHHNIAGLLRACVNARLILRNLVGPADARRSRGPGPVTSSILQPL